MPQQISKKILIYLFFFTIFGTLNNKNLTNFKLPLITEIKVYGIENDINFNKNKILDFFEFKNLFFLDEIEIKRLIDSNDIIEQYSVYKRYPSTVEINIVKTNFIAQVNVDGVKYFIGTNEKLIKTSEENKDIPFIFGDFNSQEFFKLKKAIDYSNFDYSEIENLFFFQSGRWDIKTKSGILIKLPKDKLKESLNFAINILLNDKIKNNKLIDLRQQKQLVLNE